MKSMILFITVVVSIGTTLMLSGCGNSAIECDDTDAKEIVMNIVEREIKVNLTSLSDYVYDSEKGEYLPLSQEVTARINKDYEKADPKLIKIRTEAIDERSKKTGCAARLRFSDDEEIDILYTISVTSDDKIYVEVSGI